MYVIEINQTGPIFSVGQTFCFLNVSEKTMTPYQLIRKDLILDGLERFSETISRNVNIYKSGLCVILFTVGSLSQHAPQVT